MRKCHQPDEPSSSAKMQNFSATFQTAGKGMKISVTDDSLKMANTCSKSRLQMASTKQRPLQHNRRKQINRNRIQDDENIVKSSLLVVASEYDRIEKNLRVTEAATRRQDRPPTSLRTHAPLSLASFQTAGTGSFISVSENSLARAGTLLHGSTAT